MQLCMTGEWSGGGKATGRVKMLVSMRDTVGLDNTCWLSDLLVFLLALGSPSFISQILISLTLQGKSLLPTALPSVPPSPHEVQNLARRCLALTYLHLLPLCFFSLACLLLLLVCYVTIFIYFALCI